ncbi:MAG: ATP-dependent Clp protease adapter protein ClpS [Myxococcota bacterium]|nr:ATP-dependent Clp protease adapter protein ClpS [Myxococcota bacterium]
MSEKKDNGKPGKGQGQLLLEGRVRTQKPPMYRVLLYNDNYTTMEFVVWLLMSVFHHNENDATEIMLKIHNDGMGVAGVYSYEVAETKVRETTNLARMREYPLLCTMEPE